MTWKAIKADIKKEAAKIEHEVEAVEVRTWTPPILQIDLPDKRILL
jgi:hypothetical protein